MYRRSHRPGQALLLWTGLTLLGLTACTDLFRQPPDAVDCKVQCPCECAEEVDAPPEERDDEEGTDLPARSRPYAVFLAGNVVVADGDLSVDKARERVVTERVALEKCYSKALAKDPDLKGEMNVQFTVSAPTGEIIAAIVRSSTLKDKSLKNCITGKIKAWRFKPHKGTTAAVVRFDVYMSGVTFETP